MRKTKIGPHFTFLILEEGDDDSVSNALEIMRGDNSYPSRDIVPISRRYRGRIDERNLSTVYSQIMTRWQQSRKKRGIGKNPVELKPVGALIRRDRETLTVFHLGPIPSPTPFLHYPRPQLNITNGAFLLEYA